MNLVTEQKTKTTVIPVEVYSRVSGYFRPVKQWNAGKKAEFGDRKFAHISEVKL